MGRKGRREISGKRTQTRETSARLLGGQAARSVALFAEREPDQGRRIGGSGRSGGLGGGGTWPVSVSGYTDMRTRRVRRPGPVRVSV